MDLEVLQQLFMHLTSISSDSKLKPVVIRSAGTDFSVGYDCSCHLVKDNEFLLSVLSFGLGILQIARNYDAPVVAFCHGYTLGAGLELAVLCDYSVGSEGSIYGFPDAIFGFPSMLIPPEGLSNFLERKTIKEISTGELFSIENAIKIGLMDKIGSLEDAENLAIRMNNTLFTKFKSSRFVSNEVIKSYVHYIGTMDTRKIRLKDLEQFRKDLSGTL